MQLGSRTSGDLREKGIANVKEHRLRLLLLSLQSLPVDLLRAVAPG